jgi:hypothetical protein
VALKPGRGLSFLRSSGKRFKMACFLAGFFMSSSSISGSFLLRLAKLGGGKVVAVSLGRPGLNSAAVEGNDGDTTAEIDAEVVGASGRLAATEGGTTNLGVSEGSKAKVDCTESNVVVMKTITSNGALVITMSILPVTTLTP